MINLDLLKSHAAHFRKYIKNKLDKNKIPNIINHKISFVKKYPFIEYFLYNIFFVTYIVINPHTIVIRTTYIINLI